MYDNENQTSLNGVYETSVTEPQMRLNEPEEVKVKKEKKAGKYFKKLMASISFGLCFGLFAGLGAYAVGQSTGIIAMISESNEESVRDIVQDALAAITTSSGNVQNVVATEESPSGIALTQNVSTTRSVSDVVDEVMPAMVSIVNTYVDEIYYFGQSIKQEDTGSGSGIIVGENDTELLIATNYHVIESATSITVNFIDGSSATASVKGSDPDMDLAVVAIPLASLTEDTKNAIAIATLGESEELNLGESVIAIGNALGYGQSVSTGCISALNREVTMSDGSTGTFIQTDAAINPGNSGGALLNTNGEVIGINSSKIGGSTVEGMGFAIPISAAQPILEDLMNKVTRSLVEDGATGYIGIRLQNVTSEDSKRYGMPTGIYVYEVGENTPASEAGLMRGDIIVKFDGNKINSNETLQETLKYYRAGETVDLVVMRNQSGEYQEVTLSLTLGEKPNNS